MKRNILRALCAVALLATACAKGLPPQAPQTDTPTAKISTTDATSTATEPTTLESSTAPSESVQPTEATTTEVPTTETTTTEAPTTEATTTEAPDPTIELVSPAGTYQSNPYKLYYDIAKERQATLGDDRGEGFLMDIDGNGIKELALMYPAEENQISLFCCDLYTVENGLVIPLLEKHPVYFNGAGGSDGLIGVAEQNGTRHFVLRSRYSDWLGYEEESLPESTGHWELYSLQGSVLTPKASVSYDLIQNNGNLDLPCVSITDKFDSSPMEILPDASTVTVNNLPMSIEEYGRWLDSMIFLECVDGFFSNDINSLNSLQSYCSLELFMREAEKQGVNGDALWYQWHDFMGLSDSAAWVEQEWTQTGNSIRIELGILHENPMNRGDGIDEAKTLAEKIAVQYRYWEKTGELDYMHINKDTPPRYQVAALAINAGSMATQLQVRINGVDFGTCTLEQQVLYLPINADPILANTPAVVELTLLGGTLPAESDVFVCLASNISGAR